MSPDRRQWPKTTNPAVIDDLVEQWHAGAGADQELHEFLGWTWEEYCTWTDLGGIPEE